MALYERAISTYGKEVQVTKAVEELSELSAELARYALCGGKPDEHLLAHIREELADVEIMCNQLELIFGDVSPWAMCKLERLERRLLIATTHDCYIAALLAARGAIPQFSRANWPRFLDSAAILVYPDGSRRYALVRAGLSDGICGVAV